MNSYNISVNSTLTSKKEKYNKIIFTRKRKGGKVQVFNYLSPKRKFYSFSIVDKKSRAKDLE